MSRSQPPQSQRIRPPSGSHSLLLNHGTYAPGAIDAKPVDTHRAESEHGMTSAQTYRGHWRVFLMPQSRFARVVAAALVTTACIGDGGKLTASGASAQSAAGPARLSMMIQPST